MPAVAEPWFLVLKATVEFEPVMVPADLERAGPSIEQAAQKYGEARRRPGFPRHSFPQHSGGPSAIRTGRRRP